MPWSHIFKHDAPKDAPHNNDSKKCRVAALITDQLRKIKAIGCRAISHKRSADNKSGTCSRARSITNQAKQPDAANRSRNLLLWRRRRLLVAQASSSSLQLRPQPAARKSFHMPCDQQSCPAIILRSFPSLCTSPPSFGHGLGDILHTGNHRQLDAIFAPSICKTWQAKQQSLAMHRSKSHRHPGNTQAKQSK